MTLEILGLQQGLLQIGERECWTVVEKAGLSLPHSMQYLLQSLSLPFLGTMSKIASKSISNELVYIQQNEVSENDLTIGYI